VNRCVIDLSREVRAASSEARAHAEACRHGCAVCVGEGVARFRCPEGHAARVRLQTARTWLLILRLMPEAEA
jgi:hypothetical protein